MTDTSSKKTISIDAENYKSLILGRLRAEIDAKRAFLQTIVQTEAAHLYDPDGGYWKMAYWRSGHIHRIEVVDPVIDPDPTSIETGI